MMFSFLHTLAHVVIHSVLVGARAVIVDWVRVFGNEICVAQTILRGPIMCVYIDYVCV